MVTYFWCFFQISKKALVIFPTHYETANNLGRVKASNNMLRGQLHVHITLLSGLNMHSYLLFQLRQ